MKRGMSPSTHQDVRIMRRLGKSGFRRLKKPTRAQLGIKVKPAVLTASEWKEINEQHPLGQFGIYETESYK